MTAALSCSPSPLSLSLFLTLGNKAGPEASYLTLAPLCQKVQVVTRLPCILHRVMVSSRFLSLISGAVNKSCLSGKDKSETAQGCRMYNLYKGKKRSFKFSSPVFRALSALNSVVSFLVPCMPRKPWDVILIQGIYCLFSGEIMSLEKLYKPSVFPLQ